MKKFASVLAVMALVALPVAFASGASREVALTGYLTDSYCGAANANAQGKSCALECVKKGAKVQLYANEKLYTLDQSKVADGHIGVPVKVKGTLDEGTGTIKVASIEVVKQG